MRPKCSGCLAVSLLAAVLLAASPEARAADEAAGAERDVAVLPAGVPPIPAPDDDGAKLFISSKNVSLFHEVLIAPLAAWLKEQKLIVRVVRDLMFDWEYLPPAEGGGAGEGEFTLRSDRSLHSSNPERPWTGLPFGSAEEIDKESDAQVKAYKILWNAAFAELIAPALLYDLDLSWVGSQSLLRYSTGELYREVTADSPAGEGSGAEPRLWSKQVLQLLYPPVVFGFSSISWRYRSAEPDRMWIHSPVTGQDRMLLSSNRSDNIVGSIITSDDLFVWSGKVEAFNAEVVGEKTLLAPFSSLRIYEAAAVEDFRPAMKLQAKGEETRAPAAEEDKEMSEESEPGFAASVVRAPYQTRSGNPAMVLWNHQVRRLPQAAPWAPVSVFFVPRSFWILELSPRDPFYSAGRMILAVEKQSMLPFYKVVYDRDGSLLKTVIGGWGLAKQTGQPGRFPFASFVLAVHAKDNDVSALTTQNVAAFAPDSAAARKMAPLLDIGSYQQSNEESS